MSINVNEMKTSLNSHKDKYLDLSHQLNNYNEIYNVNFYLNNLNNVEKDKLDMTNNNIKAKVLRMKQEYMTLDYSSNENKTRANIIYWTIIVASVLFIMGGMYVDNKLAQSMLITIMIIAIIVYFCTVLFILYNQTNRRKYAWDQYYWGQMKNKS